MMKRILVAALPALFLFASAAPALALDCDNAMTQNDMNMCAQDDYATADKALNIAYKKLMATLKDDENAQHLLRAAQRAWLSYRDSECIFEGHGVEGGSMQPLIMFGCKASLTKKRTEELNNQPTYGG